jgi:hypothetical protein
MTTRLTVLGLNTAVVAVHVQTAVLICGPASRPPPVAAAEEMRHIVAL